ncbi:hypothetical protein GGI12_001286 [Dipsacomyces acuminosporus]|nr:hypothetical protein GGI12_001286 [Dipsacomyces acuminosporus]
MVFYESWDSFEKAAADLYASAADRARYTVKYRNCDAELVLKVTDDATCVQLRTEKLEDIRRMARLHRKLAQASSHRANAIKELSPILPVSQKKEDVSVAKNGPRISDRAAAGSTGKQQAPSQGKKKGRGKKRGN